MHEFRTKVGNVTANIVVRTKTISKTELFFTPSKTSALQTLVIVWSFLIFLNHLFFDATIIQAPRIIRVTLPLNTTAQLERATIIVTPSVEKGVYVEVSVINVDKAR